MTLIAFRPAYSVTAEDAGDGSALPGLAFHPTEATRHRLADQGLVFRARTGGFQLFAQIIGGTGGVRRAPIRAELVLVFGIRLTDQGFSSRYGPDLTAQTGPNLFLTNRIDAGSARSSGALTVAADVGQADAVRLVGRRFLARTNLNVSPVPTALALATAYAPVRALPDVAMAASTGEPQVAVDLMTFPERTFTLAPKPPGTAQVRHYADTELAGRGAFGVLELALFPVPGPEPAGGRNFTARFRRRP